MPPDRSHATSEPRRPAVVTWGLMATCLVAFLATSGLSEAGPQTWQHFGLVPAAPRPPTALGHLFLHAGWVHLLGNLLLLFLCGPGVERRLGRGSFLLLYLAAGLVGGATFSALHPSLAVPWIGASAAVAGAMGALLAGAWRGSIRPLEGLGIHSARLEVPAWLLLPLFGVHELLSAAGADAVQVGSVADLGHLAGFGLGLCVPPLLRRTGQAPTPAPRPASPRGAASSADAVDPWQEVRAGNRLRALAAWRAGDFEAPADLRVEECLRGVAWLRHAGQKPAATRALWAGLARVDGAEALALARAARDIDPVVTLRAAECALASDALSDPQRVSAARLRSDAASAAQARGIVVLSLACASQSPPTSAAPAQAVTRAVLQEGMDEEALVDSLHALLTEDTPAAEVKAEPEPPRRPLRVLAAVPEKLEGDCLWLEVEGRGRSRLPLRRVDAVAVAGVRGLAGGSAPEASGKVVLLIDLILNWTDSQSPLTLVRLRSDRFDPRKLTPGRQTPLEALQGFLAILVREARALRLPVEVEALAQPFRIFPSLPDYAREVLHASDPASSV